MSDAEVDAEAVVKSDDEWRAALTPAQYAVLRQGATERPWTGEYVHAKDDGSFCCAGCGAELFDSSTKYESGSGWPSFTEPAVAEAVALREDRSLGTVRTEVVCKRCGGHLGHVFPDGPGPTGQRYCINSAALALKPRGAGGGGAAAGGEAAPDAGGDPGAGC